MMLRLSCPLSRRPLFPFVATALLALAMLVLVRIPAALAAGTRVVGQVLDVDTQKPIANADVELQNSGGGPGYHRARTNANGEFAIENVATNRYYLFTVGADGYTDWSLESWQFPAAQQEVKLVVPLERAGVLAVTVTTSDGRTPVSGARVTVQRVRSGGWYDGSLRDPEPRWSGKDGKLSFGGLKEGAYTVSAEVTGLRASEVRSVPVRRGETASLAVVMTKPSSFSGSVRLPDSTGVAGVSITANGAASGTATTDAGGFFTIGDLAPGRYRLEMQNDGFEPGGARDGLVLREGEAAEVGVLRARPKPATFSFVLQREVFAPDDKQVVGVRAFRIGALDFTLWRLPVARLMDAQRDFRTAYVQGSDTTGLVRIAAWNHATPDGAPFAWREEEMPLPQTLPAGVYVLEGRAGKLSRRTLFFVSDLSLVVKRSASRAVVWAGSLKTGLPLGNVALFTVGAGSSDNGVGRGSDWSDPVAAVRAARVRTDGDGLASLPAAKADPRVRIVALSDDHGVAIADAPLAGAAQQGGDKLFLFTERPIYRPGQAIFWKAFARKAAGNAWTMPPAGAVSLHLAGPDGATIDVPDAALSGAGSADGKIDIPADAPLGDWTLTADAGSASGSATLGIQEYRKPEYKVDVTPERDVLVNGDEARFTVAANYFFGASVVGATVRWTLFESRLAGEDLWAEDGADGEESGGYGRMLESGETRTDIDGRATLSFAPQRVPYDRRLSLEVEVVDASQRSVSARGSVLVGRGLFTVRLEPVSALFLAGKPVQVDVVTKDLKGNPVSASVTVDLDQDVWNPLERRYTRSSRPLASTNATTSALRGTARVTIAPTAARSGWLTLRARADDARGNRVTAETGVWVFDEKVWSYPYRYPSLEALADRDEYAPGDTAKILLNTDVKDAAVLVSVEGRELHEVRVQHLFGNSGLVKVPVKAEYGSNVFVAVHVRRGKEVHSRVLELKIKAERHDLAITLTPDRAEYRPRDKAAITVETKDAAGRPVAAEVAVGVVDEAIYSLRADDTPDPHDVFYGRLPNWVTTVVSFPTLYYGGADKGDHGDVRKDFRDVATWQPTVRTGADGRARIELQYPDNLTTWRATARGVTDATLVGTATAKTRVTKEVVARLAVPRTFTAGDEATLVSIVNNRSTQALTGVNESVEVSGSAKLAGSASATSSMAAGGESRNRWNVVAAAEPPADGSAGKATLLFRAKSKTDADALEQVVPVLPRAVALQPHDAGVVTTPTASVAVNLPADLVRSGSSLAIELSPSPAAVALAGTDWLAEYPYGCVEQTSNAILPATTLLAAAAKAGVEVPGWKEPEKRLTTFVEHLIALRAPDNGWGWWKSGDSDPYFTALALDALAHAAKAGVQTDACVSTIESSQWTLPRLLQDARNEDGIAYCAYHLSSIAALTEQHDQFADLLHLIDGLATSSYEMRDRLGTSGLACAATACARMGHSAEAKALLDLLAKRGRSDGTGLSFPPDDPEAWFGDAVENGGYALSAFTNAAPADGRATDIVRNLLARRTGRQWKSTRVSGAVATALGEYLLAHPNELAGPGRATVAFDGDEVFAGALGATGAFGRGARVTVAGAKLKPGANTLTISREGTGTLYWSWEARANVPSPGPLVKEPRLSVRREYLHATRVADRRGRPRWLVTPVDEKNPIRVGETLLARLTFTAPKALPYLLIEDPKPAGIEIDQVMPEGADQPYGLWAESRDSKAVFFVQSLEAGETRIEYLLRPEIAGAFTALPTSAGSMYDPDLLVRGGEARLRVTEKP